MSREVARGFHVELELEPADADEDVRLAVVAAIDNRHVAK